MNLHPPAKLDPRRWRRRHNDDEGASAVEYGLLIALVAVVIAAAIAVLGNTLTGSFEDANCAVTTAAACPRPAPPADGS